ncbi:hypothetical protein AHF37_02327 [Paragonimus kellicotti]|nr:hypothetical protein AHF37_02327 [Paragonimus kellicotti]
MNMWLMCNNVMLLHNKNVHHRQLTAQVNRRLRHTKCTVPDQPSLKQHLMDRFVIRRWNTRQLRTVTIPRRTQWIGTLVEALADTAEDESIANGYVIPTMGEILTLSQGSEPAHLNRSEEEKVPSKQSDVDVSLTAFTPILRPPSMWTRGELKEFTENLADTKDAVVQIGCGEVITIRVPAYPSGTSIVWEFATDDFDIGFGLFFEWACMESEDSVLQNTTATPTSNEEPALSSCNAPATAVVPSQPLVDEIIPVYRRNCHQEVYCGSHAYPGSGTYLFKFDNSYSLWRSKTLYYRVYYTC